MSREEYNRVRGERWAGASVQGIDRYKDSLGAVQLALADAIREIDRLDDEVARLKDSRQAMWDTLTSRVAKLSRLSVTIDRIDGLHAPAYDDGDPDRPPWCMECGHPYPCRTAEKIKRG